MYLLSLDGNVTTYPYSVSQLKQANPQVSFPSEITTELLESYFVFKVTASEPPAYDPDTQKLIEETPVKVVDEWVQSWLAVPLTEEEINERKAEKLAYQQSLRAIAYSAEADPLYFKAQRGEATMAEWQAKVEEIKLRYPYPE